MLLCPRCSAFSIATSHSYAAIGAKALNHQLGAVRACIFVWSEHSIQPHPAYDMEGSRTLANAPFDWSTVFLGIHRKLLAVAQVLLAILPFAKLCIALNAFITTLGAPFSFCCTATALSELGHQRAWQASARYINSINRGPRKGVYDSTQRGIVSSCDSVGCAQGSCRLCYPQ